MIILSADTSTPYLSVALTNDLQVLAQLTTHANRKHSEKLLEYTDMLLRETNTTLHDIELLAIAHGPGSFTGLRIGISAWKGLASGSHTPLIGISTLDALSTRAGAPNTPVCTLLDAKMKEVYAALYECGAHQRTSLVEETVCPLDTILEQCPDNTTFLGDGATLYQSEILDQLPHANVLSESFDYPGALAVATEAFHQFNQNPQIVSTNVCPVYLRKSQAEAMRQPDPAPSPAS